MIYHKFNNGALLKLAHITLEKALSSTDHQQNNINHLDASEEKVAIFVTLYLHDELRGCIGTIEPELPLEQAIEQYTLLSAFRDNRFPPLTKNELKDLKIEISILTKPHLVKSLDEIVFKKHGVIVEDQYGGRGVFLPEVAKSFDNLEQFMKTLCSQKLRREENFYLSENARIYTFETIKIKDVI